MGPPATSCRRAQVIRRFLLCGAASTAVPSGGDPLKSGDQRRSTGWRPPMGPDAHELPPEIRDLRLLRHAHQLRHGRRRPAGLWRRALRAGDDDFIKHFAAYRLDEVLGDWKPYAEVVHNAVERTCKRNGIAFRPEDAQRIYEEVPTWGPHPDVPAGLAKVAQEIPLVILSNAMNSADHVERGEARRAVPRRLHRRAGR